MATGPSRQSLERLTQDLSSGRVIDYRRVPTRSGFSRRYYDPRNPSETVSEHYVLRVYRPALDDIARAQQQQRTRARVSFQNMNARSIADTYVAKQASLGNIISIQDALRSEDFRTKYNALRAISFEARHSPIGSLERSAYYASDGEYAQLLVDLGRRLDGEIFNVGESPKAADNADGYINSTVLPALQSQANEVYGT